ncbi:MAG TPA: amino acid racemase [Thermoanaerobaculia bacterium]|nr:amino acid racemase [Thermoanaerobaculia bacterium]
MHDTGVKTLGIIGGIAPESTIEYYRAIVEIHRRRADGAYPSVIINSIDLTKMIGFVAAGQLDELVEYLLHELERLAEAGVALALFASNTPHIVFDRVQERSPVPLVSIVDVAAEAAVRAGVRRMALFGTRFTMQARFYREVFAARGIEVVAPPADDLELIHTKYMNELVQGQFLEATREQVLGVVERMQAAAGIDGVILGGTELPLLLRMEEWQGVRFLDTGRMHVEEAVTRMLA